MITLSSNPLACWLIIYFLQTDTIENSPYLPLINPVVWWRKVFTWYLVTFKTTVPWHSGHATTVTSLPLRNTICFRLKIKSLVRSYEVDLKLYIYRTSDNFLSGWTHIFGEFCVLVVAEITIKVDWSWVTNFLAMHLIHQDFSLEDDLRALRVYLSDKG